MDGSLHWLGGVHLVFSPEWSCLVDLTLVGDRGGGTWRMMQVAHARTAPGSRIGTGSFIPAAAVIAAWRLGRTARHEERPDGVAPSLTPPRLANWSNAWAPQQASRTTRGLTRLGGNPSWAFATSVHLMRSVRFSRGGDDRRIRRLLAMAWC